MSNLKKIQDDIKKLENISDFTLKIKSMKNIKKNINNEQENIKELKDKIEDLKPTENKKYLNLTIDQIQEKIDNCENFNEKINLYKHLCFVINKIENELFSKTNNSDSEEIDYESDSD